MKRHGYDCGQLDIVIALAAVLLIVVGVTTAAVCWKPWRWFA